MYQLYANSTLQTPLAGEVTGTDLVSVRSVVIGWMWMAATRLNCCLLKHGLSS